MFKLICLNLGVCPHNECKQGGGQRWRPPRLLRLPEGAAAHEHQDKHVGLMEKLILQESSVEDVAVLWSDESITDLFFTLSVEDIKFSMSPTPAGTCTGYLL